MATNTASWFWYSATTWPGFSSNSNSNIKAAQNGLVINPAGYADIVWNDANNDGVISDSDTDDGSGSNGDTVTVGGTAKTVKEIGIYTNSTMVVDGTTYTVSLIAWVFTDGTYGVRISDADIPPNMHHHKVTALQLGTWNGTDYSGTYVATRDDPFICFVAGTLIETAAGPRPVESLKPGDLVLTLDNGAQPLRWIGEQQTSGQTNFAPVLIRKGALGNDRDLRLSPHHRLLISDWRAEMLAGSNEVLVTAQHLTNGDTISRVPCDSVRYVHLLFDTHQIIFAEGIATESFHPSAYGLGVLQDETRAEVLALFPELDSDWNGYGPTARPCLRRWEVAVLFAA